MYKAVNNSLNRHLRCQYKPLSKIFTRAACRPIYSLACSLFSFFSKLSPFIQDYFSFQVLDFLSIFFCSFFSFHCFFFLSLPVDAFTLSYCNFHFRSFPLPQLSFSLFIFISQTFYIAFSLLSCSFIRLS